MAAPRGGATQVVRKAVTLLNCFASSDDVGGGLGFGELSSLTGWNKSTVSRLLAALEEGGLVRQDGATGRYRPGLQLVALAGAALAADGLVLASRPHLATLAVESGETANLSLVDANQLLTIAEVPSIQPIKLSGWLGARQPLHGSSSGKVLLAAMSDAQRETVLGAALAAITPATLTDRAALQRELEHTRAAGYARSVDELIPGLTSVAAPLRDHTGAVVAALSVAGPSFRLHGPHLEAATALVTRVAQDASRALGCPLRAAS